MLKTFQSFILNKTLVSHLKSSLRFQEDIYKITNEARNSKKFLPHQIAESPGS